MFLSQLFHYIGILIKYNITLRRNNEGSSLGFGFSEEASESLKILNFKDLMIQRNVKNWNYPLERNEIYSEIFVRNFEMTENLKKLVNLKISINEELFYKKCTETKNS